MRTAAFSLIAICLSAPVLADQPGGDMTGFLEETPVSWRIDAERSEYHFESDDVGSLRIFADPQEVPKDIGPIRLLVMMVEGTASLLELRLTQYGFKRQANAESIVGIRISKGNPVHTG